MTQKFLGPKKVSVVVEETIKTGSGGDVVKVVFEDGSYELMPKVTFELSITEEAKDYNYLRSVKFKAIIGEILSTFAKYDLKIQEIDVLLRDIGTEVYNSFNRATNYLWTGDDKKFTLGIDSSNDVSLLMIQNVLNKVDEIKTDK